MWNCIDSEPCWSVSPGFSTSQLCSSGNFFLKPLSSSLAQLDLYFHKSSRTRMNKWQLLHFVKLKLVHIGYTLETHFLEMVVLLHKFSAKKVSRLCWVAAWSQIGSQFYDDNLLLYRSSIGNWEWKTSIK